MLESPAIPDKLILARLEDEYGLHNARIIFLSIGADRERSFGWFRSNFEPGRTIEIADETYRSVIK